MPTSDTEVGIRCPGVAARESYTETPRTFIAMSAGLTRRGPSRRASMAVIRARVEGVNAGGSVPDSARQVSACPSAAAASARNNSAMRASGSQSASSR